MKNDPKSDASKQKKAGNAVFDPAEQDCRQDLADGAQQSCNEPRRGTAPPAEAAPPRSRVEREDPSRAKGSPPLAGADEEQG